MLRNAVMAVLTVVGIAIRQRSERGGGEKVGQHKSREDGQGLKEILRSPKRQWKDRQCLFRTYLHRTSIERQLAVACVVFSFLCPRSLVGWLWCELSEHTVASRSLISHLIQIQLGQKHTKNYSQQCHSWSSHFGKWQATQACNIKSVPFLMQVVYAQAERHAWLNRFIRFRPARYSGSLLRLLSQCY